MRARRENGSADRPMLSLVARVISQSMLDIVILAVAPERKRVDQTGVGSRRGSRLRPRSEHPPPSRSTIEHVDQTRPRSPMRRKCTDQTDLWTCACSCV